MATITINPNKEILVDGNRIVFPRDANIDYAPPLFGIAPNGSFKPVAIDNDGKLVVDLDASEITIGAVEIIDHESGEKLDIVTDGTTINVDNKWGIFVLGSDGDQARYIPIVDLGSGKFAVNIVDEPATAVLEDILDSLKPGTSVLETDTEDLVIANSQATIITYAVGVTPLYLDGFTATGNVDADFTLHINTAEKLCYRTSEQDRTAKVFFPTPQKVAAGSIIDIKVIHFYTAWTASFKATIIGHR
jgi:hypothetical protein